MKSILIKAFALLTVMAVLLTGCAATPEATMRNMGRIASPGMVGTEKTMIEILEEK